MGTCKHCVHWNLQGMSGCIQCTCIQVPRAGIHATLDHLRMTDEERVFMDKVIIEKSQKERKILGQMKMRFTTTADFGCVLFEAKPEKQENE